jgi:hypothetical protein
MQLVTKLGAVAALAVAATFGSAAHAAAGYNYPNFTGAGAPGVGFAAVSSASSLTLVAPNTYQLQYTGSANGLLNFGPGANTAYNVNNEQVAITAFLKRTNNTWNVTGGTYTITGSIAGCSSGCPAGFNSWAAGSGTLFSAKLTPGTLTTNTTDKYIGFRTEQFSGWAISQGLNTGSMAESLYLYASSTTPAQGVGTAPNIARSVSNSTWNNFVAALNSGNSISAGSFANVGSYATIPLPLPAVLLLGGLASLGGVVRRRKAGLATA